MSNHPEVTSLRSETDPFMRAMKALVKIQDANDLIEELNQVRAEAIYEVYKVQGATRTARLFDRSRSNIHRLIKPIQAKDPQWIALQIQRMESFNTVLAQTRDRFNEIDKRREILDSEEGNE